MSVIGKPRDERGAVAPFVAVLIVLLVGLASFAVDLGYQRVAARDMQAVADIVAMDMARQLDGTKGNVLKNTDRWKDAVRASLARNDDQTVGDSLTAVPCGESLNTLPNNQSVVCATPGIYNPATGDFTLGGNQPATHVRVVTRTRVDYFFPVFADDGWVTKTAYAEGGGATCFRLSSYLAEADLNSGLLGPVLDAISARLSLSVADAKSLADLDLSLADILGADVAAGTLGEALDSSVSLADYYVALAKAAAAGGASTADVSLLQSISTRVAGLSLKLADVLALATGEEAGLRSQINALDMVGFGLVAANGENGLALGVEMAPIDGLGSLSVRAHVVQKPQVSCGKRKSADNPTAETSQIKIAIGGTPTTPAGPLNALVSTVRTVLDTAVGAVVCVLNIPCTFRSVVEVTPRIDLAVVPAKARLSDVECSGATRKVYFQIAGGNLLEVTINAGLAIRLQTKARVPSDSPWKDIGSVTAGTTLTTHAQGEEWQSFVVELDGSETSYEVPAKWGGGELGLPGMDDFAITTTGPVVSLGDLDINADLILTPVLNLVSGVTGMLVGGLDTVLLGPLTSTLGVDVAGAKLLPLKTPSCGSAALRG